MGGDGPLYLFLGVVAAMAAFVLARRAAGGRRDARGRRPSRRSADGSAGRSPSLVATDSSRGPGGTDGGASDGGASMRGD